MIAGVPAKFWSEISHQPFARVQAAIGLIPAYVSILASVWRACLALLVGLRKPARAIRFTLKSLNRNSAYTENSWRTSAAGDAARGTCGYLGT